MVIITAVFTVNIMLAQLELHLLDQFGQQGVLPFRRKLRKHKVTFRLPLSPYLLKGTGIEHGKRHEVFRIEALFVIIEIALGIFQLRVLLTLLKHFPGFHSGQADFLLHTGNDHDQPFFHNLIAGGGKSKDLLQYLAIVIGVLYYYCHSSYLLSLFFISFMRLSQGLSLPGSTRRSVVTLFFGFRLCNAFSPFSRSEFSRFS